MIHRLKRSFLAFALSYALVSLLAACNGDSDNNDNKFTQGSLDAHVSDTMRVAYSGQAVSLHGFVTQAKGHVSYRWQQLDGDPVQIRPNTKSADVIFTAPTVDGDTPKTLTFRLLATDDTGSDYSPEVKVEVRPEKSLVVNTLTDSRNVIAGHSVSLHAEGGGGGSAATYSWKQLSPEFPKVSFGGTGNTANPTFTAPDVDGVTFLFEVTYSDGSQAVRDRTRVNVYRQATSGSTLPLGVTSNNLNTPQVLQLGAPHNAEVIEGDIARLATVVTGGVQPYAWQWQQVDGPDVLFSETDQVLVVTAPDVSAPEFLTFKVTVTDNNGASATGTVRVLVLDSVPTGTGPVVTDKIIRPQVDATTGTPIIIETTLKNIQVTQTHGTRGLTSSLTELGGTTSFKFTALPITTHTEHVELMIIGKNASGDTVAEIVPIRVHEPAPDPLMTPHPVVAASEPVNREQLTVTSCGLTHANEGQQDVALAACVRGGTTGFYSYFWDYVPGAPGSGAPATLVLTDGNTSHPTFDAPAVDGTVPLEFNLRVRDKGGKQIVDIPVTLVVNDLANTIEVDAVSNLIVASGHEVTLHPPVVRGGVPPYTWTVSQNVGFGPSVGPLVGDNPTFTAPMLSPGPSITLTFVYKLEDALGNKAEVTEYVLVKAPSNLVADLQGTSSANQGEEVTLHANVTGGNPPYAYDYTAAASPISIPGEANPRFKLPALAAGDSNLDLEITLNATDRSLPTLSARDSLKIEVVAPEAPRSPGPSAAEKYKAALEALPPEKQNVAGITETTNHILQGFNLRGIKAQIDDQGNLTNQACNEDFYTGDCSADYAGRCGEPLISYLCGVTCNSCVSIPDEMTDVYQDYIHANADQYPDLYKKLFGQDPAQPQVCEDLYLGDCAADFPGRCDEFPIGDLCAKTCNQCTPCEDLYIGDCALDFPGRCDEPLIRGVCAKTCGACP